LSGDAACTADGPGDGTGEKNYYKILFPSH
jgi:hypothetical protein